MCRLPERVECFDGVIIGELFRDALLVLGINAEASTHNSRWSEGESDETVTTTRALASLSANNCVKDT